MSGGGWVLVAAGRHRCDECGERFVGRAWLYFATLTVSTRCVCESCAETLVAS